MWRRIFWGVGSFFHFFFFFKFQNCLQKEGQERAFDQEGQIKDYYGIFKSISLDLII